MNADAFCESCGCTEDDACFDAVSGSACYWVSPGLCSCCAREDLCKENLVQTVSESEAEAFVGGRLR